MESTSANGTTVCAVLFVVALLAAHLGHSGFTLRTRRQQGVAVAVRGGARGGARRPWSARARGPADAALPPPWRWNLSRPPDFAKLDAAEFTVVTLWINLEHEGATAHLRQDPHRKLTKHGYNLTTSVRVRAPYYIFCDAGEAMVRARQPVAAYGPTTLDRGWSVDKVVKEIASRLAGVTEEQVWAAARKSVWATDRHAKSGRCPSAELNLIWVAKPFFVAKAMERSPGVRAFAYVDAGFAHYVSAARRRGRAPARVRTPRATARCMCAHGCHLTCAR